MISEMTLKNIRCKISDDAHRSLKVQAATNGKTLDEWIVAILEKAAGKKKENGNDK